MDTPDRNNTLFPKKTTKNETKGENNKFFPVEQYCFLNFQ